MSEYFDKLKRCNFRDGGSPDPGVPRPRHVARIQGFMNNRLTKVLMGQRRCGKSFILRQIMAALVKDGVCPQQARDPSRPETGEVWVEQP